MTWHVCVYHRDTGNSIYNFEEKANRKMDEEKKHTQLGNNELLFIAAREEERNRRRGEKKKASRVGGRRKRQGMGGAQSREKNLKDGGCTFIYCTHSMTDLHTIVVNSFVF